MKIFLSHSSRDKPLVREVKRALPECITTWMDEIDMHPGEDIEEKLSRSIQLESDFVIVFFSTEAVQSDWVRKELSWALDREKECGRSFVVPVLLDAVQDQISPVEFRARKFLECFDRTDMAVKAFAGNLSSHLTGLLIQSVDVLVDRAQKHSEQSKAQIWRRRAEIAPAEWIKAFSGAQERIWLLGHSMLPAVDPARSGAILAERLAAGVDLRLVVLDPFGMAHHQVSEISKRIDDPDLRSKILRTLRLASTIERSVASKMEQPYDAASREQIDAPSFSIGVTHATMHSSIVVIDDRFLVTTYSTNHEMGDMGITLDLNKQNDDEVDLCEFFERDFLCHWHRSRSYVDAERALPLIELRVLNYSNQTRASVGWYERANQPLPPPFLAVMFPTYRCLYGARRSRQGNDAAAPDGPFAKQLLCPNCMYGEIITGGRTSEMPVDQFAKVCAELSRIGVRTIEIAGGGEPLHHQQASKILERVLALRSVKEGSMATRFGLLSNVAALSECDFCEVILQSLDYVRWSWPEDAELQPSLQQKYVGLLTSFLELRDRLQSHGDLHNPIRIGVKVLVTKRNAEGIWPPVVSLVKNLLKVGVDHVKVRTLRSAVNQPSATQLRRVEDALARLTYQLHLDGTLFEPKSLEVDLRERFVPTEHRCKLSTLTTLIEPSGNARMCWNDTRPDHRRVIGNVFHQPFDEIWGSPRHRDICRAMDPELVCNSLLGCHCRFVGYQEVAEQLMSNEMRMDDTISAHVIRDQFL